jgi:hypothetical protein
VNSNPILAQFRPHSEGHKPIYNILFIAPFNTNMGALAKQFYGILRMQQDIFFFAHFSCFWFDWEIFLWST